MDHRSVARMLAAGRVVVGVALLLAPGVVARTWTGPTGRTSGAKLLARSVGTRELVLGLGVLGALDRGDPRTRDWVRASALADLGDVAATVLGFGHLPRSARFGAPTVAGAAAALGFVAAENLD